MASDGPAGAEARPIVLTLLVGIVLACWMLLMPQGSQPDEHSHLVRSAALVRGADGDGVYTLPDRYRVAEPACYAFQPAQPVSCSAVPRPTGAEIELATRADDYPPGAHLVFGLTSLLPVLAPVWWARLGATTISALLIGFALAHSRDRLTAAALLLGLTPMAWSIMTAVNPSAFATAGAAALWVAGLRLADDAPAATTAGTRGAGTGAATLAVAGWLALATVRRDGLVWACIIVATVAVTSGTSLRGWARWLGRWRLAALGLGTLVPVVWGATSSSSTSRAVVLAPAALVAAELWSTWRRADEQTPSRRAASLAAFGVLGMGAWLALLTLRPGGWNSDLLLRVVAQTDENVVEAIGVLGWLDTPVPYVAVFVWLLLIGVLIAAAGLGDGLAPAAALVVVTILTSWTFEMLQGNNSGTYWQGRYSLPLLVGVPLLLARAADRRARQRFAGPIAVVALTITNVGAWAAARRFGVGHAGSYLPWRWGTALQPVQPLLLLLVMAAASFALAAVVVGPRNRHR